MKRFSACNTFANPFLLWTELAWKTGETMMASAEVIGHRSNRMAAAGPAPGRRDRREFALMGQEKIAAANESSRAIAASMIRMNPLVGLRAMTQSMAVANALMSFATSRTVGQSMRRQAALLRTLVQSGKTATQFSNAAAQAAHQGLKPIHSRVTANAKRLRKA